MGATGRLTGVVGGAALLLMITAVLCAAGSAQPTDRTATVIELNGAIGPAMSHYVDQALQDAEQHSAVAILQIDTPGGLCGRGLAVIDRDAGHHQDDSRLADPDCGLRCAERRAGRQRRHLYPVRLPSGGNGTRD